PITPLSVSPCTASSVSKMACSAVMNCGSSSIGVTDLPPYLVGGDPGAVDGLREVTVVPGVDPLPYGRQERIHAGPQLLLVLIHLAPTLLWRTAPPAARSSRPGWQPWRGRTPGRSPGRSRR